MRLLCPHCRCCLPDPCAFAWPSLVGGVQHRQLATRAQTLRSFVRHVSAVPTSSTLHMPRPAVRFCARSCAELGASTHTHTQRAHHKNNELQLAFYASSKLLLSTSAGFRLENTSFKVPPTALGSCRCPKVFLRTC